MTAPPRFDFFEVVRIDHSTEATELEVDGQTGVVLGVSVDEETGEISYAIQIHQLGTVIFREEQLTATGRSVPPESIYDGSRVHVSRNGRIDTGSRPATDARGARDE